MGEIPIARLTNSTYVVGSYLMLRTKDLTVWWIDLDYLVHCFRGRSRYPDRHFPDGIAHPRAVDD